MSRIPPLAPGDTEGQVDELLRETAGWYGDTAYFGVIAHRPALLERLVALFEEFPESEHIEPSLLELVRLKVAQDHQCAYCGTVRTQDVRDDVAPKEQALFAGDLDSDVFTRREQLAVDLADRLSEDPLSIDEAFFTNLGDAFTDEEIVELLLFAALEVGLDRFCIALRLDTTGASSYPTNLEYPREPEPQSGE